MAIKRSKTAVIEAAGAEFSLSVSERESGVLIGSETFFEHGRHFLSALGVFENYLAGMGVPVGSSAVRKRSLLLLSAESLEFGLKRDYDLLSFDYSYSFVVQGKRRTNAGSSGFMVRGFYGLIGARPPGYCTLKLSELSPIGKGRLVEIIDLRNRTEMETDDAGIIQIHKRRVEFTLPERISQLVDFLKQHRCDEAVVRFV